MKKFLSVGLTICCISIVSMSFGQFYSQQNITVKISGSTPATTWANAGAPLFTGYGEQTTGNADYILSMASTLANARPVFIGRRGRGTLAVPAAVASNDFLMSFLASGHDGSSFQNPASIDFYVDGTPSTGNVPARISFVTGSNSTNRAERLKIGNTGDINFNGTQMFLQRSTGRLGLGTITPGGQLELSLDQGRKPSTSTWTITSDARLKNIEGAYEKGLADILKLNPVAYYYKNVGNRKFDESILTTKAFGFAAQDVQKVFPEAVGTDADGYLNLNIHPILIASINAFKNVQKQLDEKNAAISKQQAEIDNLKSTTQQQQTQIALLMQKFNALEGQAKMVNQNETVQAIEKASLEQNAPNPVNNNTVIKYRLPKEVKNAQMIITDARGSIIKTMTLNAKGNGQVTLSAGALTTGSYFYSLLVDGVKSDTKEMQIVK